MTAGVTHTDTVGAGSRGTDDPPSSDNIAAESVEWHQRRAVRFLLALVPFLFAIVAWQVISAMRFEGLRYAIPDPAATWRQLVADLADRTVWASIWLTLKESLLGLLIGAAGGLVLGALLGLVRVLHTMAWPAIVFFQAIPKIALAPLMVIIFGFGIGSKVALAASISFFPILIGVIGGVRAVRMDEIELLRSLNASRWQQFRTIRVPRALPSTFGGFQIGAVFALMAAVVTEFLGANAGLGYLIQLRSSQLQAPGVFSALIILSVIGVLISLVLTAVDNRLSRWEE